MYLIWLKRDGPPIPILWVHRNGSMPGSWESRGRVLPVEVLEWREGDARLDRAGNIFGVVNFDNAVSVMDFEVYVIIQVSEQSLSVLRHWKSHISIHNWAGTGLYSYPFPELHPWRCTQITTDKTTSTSVPSRTENGGHTFRSDCSR